MSKAFKTHWIKPAPGQPSCEMLDYYNQQYPDGIGYASEQYAMEKAGVISESLGIKLIVKGL